MKAGEEEQPFIKRFALHAARAHFRWPQRRSKLEWKRPTPKIFGCWWKLCVSFS